ncbi:acyltransferase family protein [Macrococcus brunensis]|uniref:acyltransferase family protein n=1 Tax=Macrococcus brunensis TaxID=198483 RepID=UPI001EEFDC4A|nr:acyltransferase [Macrococcus brunensis]ULG74956.1 acyltransferase [Macrococcus brunensis]
MNKKIEYLDALRGLAILGVMTTHVTVAFPELLPITFHIGKNGSRGVQLFFIVSAFTLMLSLQRAGKLELKSFYIKRFFRIAPAFYMAFLFYFLFNVIKYILHQDHALSAYLTSNVIGTLAFLNVLRMDWLFSLVPGGWSISNEFLFYLVLPLIYVTCRSLKQAFIWLILTMMAGIALTMLSLHYYTYNPKLYMYYFYWFPNQLPIFCMGILLFFIVSYSKEARFSPQMANIFLWLSVFLMIALSTMKFEGYLLYFNHYLYGLLFSLFAFCLSVTQTKIFVNHFLVYIGQISFSMYLIHFFFVEMLLKCLKALHLYEPGNILSYVLMLLSVYILSIIAAHFSYHYLEWPGIQLGRKWIKKLNRQS